ncbi:NUDIX hydrolase [Halobaculum gomorrense]|uniref:ADP-ribose pyrophosphatase YjhB, NUDIX family n=1 Tax=Halobaculum gomorrense TaxID=43928 RepID=A0A1M5PAP5_9EURY|nr:NUDIX domain-containing protein [Halobaculum gomorrense]SHG98840.1 ADP-ribose pyrophosphatase YjhB, NUDIX family [Halobaculum gomorrense]
METTRHFTATVYLVHDGATALHDHPRLGIRIPPGGHVDRDELPHEAGLREAREETGLDPTLIDDTEAVGAPAGETLPTPRHTMLYDINVHDDGTVGHQHIDSVYFAAVDDRRIDPDGDDEVGADAWAWYTPGELRESDVDSDTTAIGIEAIETVGAAGER